MTSHQFDHCHNMSTGQSSLPDLKSQSFKSTFPLVNLRLLSHLKYHIVKEKLKHEAQKLARANSICKGKAEERVPKHLDLTMSPQKIVSRKLTHMTTLKQKPVLPHFPSHQGFKSDPPSQPDQPELRKTPNFWPKKLREVQKTFKAFDLVHRRNLSLEA